MVLHCSARRDWSSSG